MIVPNPHIADAGVLDPARARRRDRAAREQAAQLQDADDRRGRGAEHRARSAAAGGSRGGCDDVAEYSRADRGRAAKRYVEAPPPAAPELGVFSSASSAGWRARQSTKSRPSPLPPHRAHSANARSARAAVAAGIAIGIGEHRHGLVQPRAVRAMTAVATDAAAIAIAIGIAIEMPIVASAATGIEADRNRIGRSPQRAARAGRAAQASRQRLSGGTARSTPESVRKPRVRSAQCALPARRLPARRMEIRLRQARSRRSTAAWAPWRPPPRPARRWRWQSRRGRRRRRPLAKHRAICSRATIRRTAESLPRPGSRIRHPRAAATLRLPLLLRALRRAIPSRGRWLTSSRRVSRAAACRVVFVSVGGSSTERGRDE